jgi:hypothetical protein
MRIPLFVAATLLVATTVWAQSPVATLFSAQNPAAALGPSPRITLKFVNARFADAVAAVAQASGISVQLDDSVTADLRDRPLRYPIISVANSTIDEVLWMLIDKSGLTYVVVDANTVRIKANP